MNAQPAPAFSVDDLPIKYRVGRKNGHTLYLGGNEPHDTDLFIGSCRSKSMARTLAECANVGLMHMNANAYFTRPEHYEKLQQIVELRDAEPFPDEDSGGDGSGDDDAGGPERDGR